MRSRIIHLFIISCLLGGSALGQAIDSTLTFKEAVDIALQNNIRLNQERNNLFRSQVNKTSAIAQLGPQASINANAGMRNGNSFIQQEGRVVNATVYGASASLNVQMPVFNGLSGINLARSSSHALDAQMELVKRTTQDVINLVSSQFLQVLLDQELLKIAQENLIVQKTQNEQVKAQVELGSRSPVDEYNQQAQVSNAELRVVQAEFQLLNDKATLFQTLLIDPTVKILIEEPSWDANAIALESMNLDQVLSQAMANRSDLKSTRHIEKGSKFAMNVSKGNYLPSLNAVYSNSSAWNQLKGAQRDSLFRDFNDQFFSDNRSNYLGLSLNIPIFTGFRNRATYVQSKVLYENTKLITKNIEVLVKGDVLRAYENFQSIKKAYSAGLTGLEASEMAYNLERERFNLGITSFVDFANANRTYIQAQTDMAQAKYRFLFQKIMLDYATGTLKPEDIP